MNKKTSLIIFLSAVVLLGVWWLVNRSPEPAGAAASGTSKVGKKILADFPVNDVASINFTKGTDKLTLSKSGDIWTVNERAGYAADFNTVRDLLVKMVDLKGVQDVPVGPSQVGRLELNKPGAGDPSGTLVELKKADGGALAALLLGKSYVKDGAPNPMGFGGSFPVGRYVTPADKTEVSLVSEPFAQVETKPSSWLDRQFIQVQKLKSIETKSPDAANSWKLSRADESGEFKLEGDIPAGKELDSTRLATFKSFLAYGSFEDVKAKDTPPAEVGFDTATTATLETSEGFTYLLTIGKKTADGQIPIKTEVKGSFPDKRVPAADEKPEDKDRLDKEFAEKLKTEQDKLAKEQKFQGWVYLMPATTVEDVLKPRSEFLKDTPPPAPAAPPAGATPETPLVLPGGNPAPPATEVTTPPIEVTAPK